MHLSRLALFLLFPVIHALGVERPSEIGATGGREFCKKEIVAAIDSMAAAQRTWENPGLTDPGNHQNNDFRYLVHTLAHGGSRSDLTHVYDFLVDSSDELYFISASLFDSKINNRSYLGNFGFILETPTENIVATMPEMGRTQNTWKKDGTSLIWNDDSSAYLKEMGLEPPATELNSKNYENHLYSTWGILSPDALVAATQRKQMEGYQFCNEVFIQRVGATGKRVKITGAFVLKSRGIDPSHFALSREKVFSQAKSLSLPVVEIEVD